MRCLKHQAGAESSTRDRRSWVAVSFFMLAATLVTGPVSAHDVWLGIPAGVAPNEVVKARLFQGHGGQSEPLARNDRRLQRLYAIDPAAAETELPGLHGGDPAGLVRPGTAGSWTIVYQSRTAPHITDADVFRRHLELEGLDHVLDQRRRSGRSDTQGRELYSRTLKALLVVGPGPVIDRAQGFDVELVLEAADSDRVILQALRGGRPQGDVLVDLHPLRPGPETPIQSARTDADGRVELAAPSGEAKVWVATAVLAEPMSEAGRSANEPDLDWRTYFTALTFPRP